MSISSLTNFTSKLWEAFEKSTQSTGADFKSPTGSSALPDKELIKKFEDALNNIGNNASDNTLGSMPVDNVGMPIDIVEKPDDKFGLVKVDKLLSHENLYQLQYNVTFMQIQSSSFSGVSQKSTEAFTTVLKDK